MKTYKNIWLASASYAVAMIYYFSLVLNIPDVSTSIAYVPTGVLMIVGIFFAIKDFKESKSLFSIFLTIIGILIILFPFYAVQLSLAIYSLFY